MKKLGKTNKKEIIIKFEGSEILERKASKFGTGCHIIIPKEHAGKKVKIIIEEEGVENE
jgi:putative transposon-encoded protein